MNVSRVGGQDVYFSETDFELVRLFAAQAAVALRNADEHHAMSLRAETDALTGLGNHGAFQRDLARMADEPHPSPIRRGQLLYNIFITRTEGHATGWEEMMLQAGMLDARARSRELIYVV